MNTLQIIITADTTDVIQSVCAISVMIIALVALFSWKSQKKFEARMELLSNTDKAMQYIRLLRKYDLMKTNYSEYLIVYKEFKTGEFDDIFKKRQYFHDMALQLKEPELTNLYNVVVDMRAKSWALFGKEDEFYKFYEKVLDINRFIYLNHASMKFVLEEQSKLDITQERRDIAANQESIFHDRIYERPMDDSIINDGYTNY
jgi:hypothetical protein